VRTIILIVNYYRALSLRRRTEKISTALPNRPVYKDIRRDPSGNEGWIKSKFIATLSARTTVFDLELLVWRTSQEWSPLSAMSGIRLFAVVLTFLYDRRAFRIPVDAPRSPRHTPYNSTSRKNLGDSSFSSDQIWKNSLASFFFLFP